MLQEQFTNVTKLFMKFGHLSVCVSS